MKTLKLTITAIKVVTKQIFIYILLATVLPINALINLLTMIGKDEEDEN